MNIDIKSADSKELLQVLLKQLLEQLITETKVLPPLSIPQLAERYNVSKATVHNWMKQGLVKGFKMGKGRFFHLDEVEKSLTQYRHLETLKKRVQTPQ